ncbi:MAG: hypothetical protein JRD88_04930 [Deltaproteobacteria bacterium]|nr:hypothetical protein [Deltaproteobacteria bacterium]
MTPDPVAGKPTTTPALSLINRLSTKGPETIQTVVRQTASGNDDNAGTHYRAGPAHGNSLVGYQMFCCIAQAIG